MLTVFVAQSVVSEMESKEQINERSSATESAVLMNEDDQNLAADDEAADKSDSQVNNCILPFLLQWPFIITLLFCSLASVVCRH